VVLGLHYPTDVLAGGLLGAAIALTTMSWMGA
jgi:membrane-associated phospholipid phosphatase